MRYSLLVQYSLTTDSCQETYVFLQCLQQSYTCKLIFNTTTSLQSSTNSKIDLNPKSANNTQKPAAQKHYRTMSNSNATPDQRHEWYVDDIQLDCFHTRRRPDDYVPFQSMFQPDGRHAYNPNGPRYPEIGLGGWGTSRDGSLMPSRGTFPRDVVVPMGIHPHMMQHGPGNGSRGEFGGGVYGGGGYGGRR